jgi:hypothetical protein
MSDLVRQRRIVESHNRLEGAEASFTLHCCMVEEAERAEDEYRTATRRSGRSAPTQARVWKRWGWP